MGTLLFSFRGTIGRLEYILASLGILTAAVAVHALLDWRGLLQLVDSDPAPVPTTLLGYAIFAACLWPNLALTTKRMRDRGYAPWSIMAVGAIIVVSIFRGDPGAYGLKFIDYALAVFVLWLVIDLALLKGRGAPANVEAPGSPHTV